MKRWFVDNGGRDGLEDKGRGEQVLCCNFLVLFWGREFCAYDRSMETIRHKFVASALIVVEDIFLQI